MSLALKVDGSCDNRRPVAGGEGGGGDGGGDGGGGEGGGDGGGGDGGGGDGGGGEGGGDGGGGEGLLESSPVAMVTVVTQNRTSMRCCDRQFDAFEAGRPRPLHKRRGAWPPIEKRRVRTQCSMGAQEPWSQDYTSVKPVLPHRGLAKAYPANGTSGDGGLEPIWPGCPVSKVHLGVPLASLNVS